MPQTPRLAVGATLSVVAASPTTFDPTGFAALSWTGGEIGGLSKIGTIGVDFNLTDFKLLKTGLTLQLKGSQKPMPLPLEMATMEDDVGQVKLKSGNNGANKQVLHSFKLVEGNGAITYWQGYITSYTKSVEDADSVSMSKCNVTVNTATVEVAPT